MGRRLILDTGVLIAVERGAPTPAREDDDLAVAAITVSELLLGVELADARHRSRREAVVTSLLSTLTVLAFDAETARAHAPLAAHARRSGTPRGAHGLIIAATASATGRTVVTTDARGFDGLPGVSCVLLSSM